MPKVTPRNWRSRSFFSSSNANRILFQSTGLCAHCQYTNSSADGRWWSYGAEAALRRSVVLLKDEITINSVAAPIHPAQPYLNAAGLIPPVRPHAVNSSAMLAAFSICFWNRSQLPFLAYRPSGPFQVPYHTLPGDSSRTAL